MLRKNKILIAEANIELQELLIEVFRQLTPDLRVKFVTNGSQAAKYIQSCPYGDRPRLIFLNYELSGLDAVEVLAEVRDQLWLNDVVKVIWASVERPMVKDRCLRGGADHFLLKPSRPSDLKGAIKQVLGMVTL